MEFPGTPGDPFGIIRRAVHQYLVRQTAVQSPIVRRVTSGANAAAVAAIKNDPGKRLIFHAAQVYTRGGTVSADAVVIAQAQDVGDEAATMPAEGVNASPVWVGVLGNGALRGSSIGFVDDVGIECASGRSLVLQVPALGVGVISELLLIAWQEPERTFDV